jgi:hypothetical protein
MNFYFIISWLVISINCIDYEKVANGSSNSEPDKYGSVHIGPDYNPVQLTAGIRKTCFLNTLILLKMF